MYDTCPNPECQADQRTERIPEEHKHLYAGEWFYRTVGHYAFDMTLFYSCPVCSGAWHRFAPDTRNYFRAAALMSAEGLDDFTPKTSEV